MPHDWGLVDAYSPTATTVITWSIPFLLAAATLWIYHLFQIHSRGPTVAFHTIGNPQGQNRQNIISQIPRHLYAQASAAQRTLGGKAVLGWVLIIGAVVTLIIGIVLVATNFRPSARTTQTNVAATPPGATVPSIPPAISNAPPPTPPPSRPLSPYEAEKKVRVIDQFIDLVGSGMQRTIDEGPRLQTGAWNAFSDPKNNPTYNDDLSAFVNLARKNMEQLESLRTSHPEYQDVITIVTNQVSPSGSAANFRQVFQILQTYLSKDADNSHFALLIRPTSEQFERDNASFRQWRDITLRRLVDLRREISP